MLNLLMEILGIIVLGIIIIVIIFVYSLFTNPQIRYKDVPLKKEKKNSGYDATDFGFYMRIKNMKYGSKHKIKKW